ncbi:MAG TPA: prolyl oligopeptidase family serine peptidase, partial [Candidatus Polarisedimenticolaceae bacterium]|nr:prolyl oligopeptidase family serine peptidase [Candidatus Polarisedimenticolaceae bacterium]
NPATDETRAITRDFDPAVVDAKWSAGDGRIYLLAEERDTRPLFRFDPETDSFERLDTGYDVNRELALARNAPTVVLLASSPWVAERLVAVDGARDAARTLEHPAGEWLAGVSRGTVEPWTFVAANGKTIDGRVYVPPDFDAGNRYPAIVYYYGGTSPVGREFGGRYPKEWWAAQGYVVYVPQPSGATGFGQEFSAAHVNDWGKTTSEEIIEGTRRFLEAHPFVDAGRVGCIGASYGGFMTMLLSTKTDLFAAAVSHAGISSLASYWGEGYWGFLYSSVATAESYPWNRKDIYVDQSPLYRADENRVPILLTHGVADTNVPVGESDAFYVALELLGKEVEYLQIEGENHWIVDHAKRVVWSRSIVAWFDRWLKDEPQWWQALYPPGGPPAPDEKSKTAR